MAGGAHQFQDVSSLSVETLRTMAKMMRMSEDETVDAAPKHDLEKRVRSALMAYASGKEIPDKRGGNGSFADASSNVQLASSDIVLTSSPTVWHVSGATLLDFGVFRSLKRRSVLEIVTLVYALAVFACDTLEPGMEMLQFQAGDPSTVLTLKKRHPLEIWTVNCASILGWLVVAHFQVKALLKMAALSIEPVIISCSIVCGEAVKLSNRFSVALAFDSFEVGWAVAEITYRLVAIFPLTVFLSTLDAVICPRILKTLFLGLCACTKAYHCFGSKFLSSEWTDEEICIFGFCEQNRRLYVMASANLTIFISKLLLQSFVRDFVVIRPCFELPSTMARVCCACLHGRLPSKEFLQVVPHESEGNLPRDS